jgi:cobalt-zinc-cadmium resistance protein CzcA
MAQPISDRVDEMVTGVRSDVAVKVFGDDLDVLREEGWPDRQGGAGMQGAPGHPRSSGQTGQQYLSIEIDRQAIARLGLNVSDVNDVIEAAIGGKVPPSLRGRTPLPGRGASAGALPRQRRGHSQHAGDLAERRPGAAVESGQHRSHDGPAQISRELASAASSSASTSRTATSAASSPNCSRRSTARSSCRKAITWSGAASSRTWSGRWAT